MKVDFVYPKNTRIIRSFCNYILRWLRKDIRSQSNLHTLQMRLNFLYETKAIHWVSEPLEISASEFIQVLADNIDWRRHGKHYVIRIDPKATFPGSYTSLEYIARYVDFGLIHMKGCFFISNIFRKYQENIYRYLAMYKMKIGR